MTSRFSVTLLIIASLGASCSPVTPCSTSAQCSSDQVCVQGQCRALGSTDSALDAGPLLEPDAGVTRDAGAGGGSGLVDAGGKVDAGKVDAGPGGTPVDAGGGAPAGCDPATASSPIKDSDCDGLSDAEERTTTYVGGLKTNPCLADTDGDGLADGLEVGRYSSVALCSFTADADPNTKTLPTAADSDRDGLGDGDEDSNLNGQQDPGETNPSRADSDCDGLSDKHERTGSSGCVTDPLKQDSDGDGLPDGVEASLVAPGADPTGCHYPATTFDTEVSTKTDACSADSDGDGVADGAEDTDHDGHVDSGELDPTNPSDAMGPAQQACSASGLRPVMFLSNGEADVQVALPTDFSEHSILTVGSAERGFAFYDPSTKVAGIAFSKLPSGATDGTGEEAFNRSKLGAVSNPLIQSFTTWDGFVSSARGTYSLTGTPDVKQTINAIAQAFLGATVTGTLQGSAPSPDATYTLQVEYVYRTSTRAAVVIALVPSSLATGRNLFRLDDTANGTALAQFGDYSGTQCEVFEAQVNQKVDFLWVVDDSCSMASSQTAVQTAGSLFAAKLQNAGLDWRVAGVSTGYFGPSWMGHFFDWTTSVSTMQGWFGTSGFGTNGNGSEHGFEGAQAFVMKQGPSPTPQPFRADAALHFIFLSDTADQSPLAVSDLRGLMATTAPNRPFLAHGIVCPENSNCGDDTAEVNIGKYHTLVRQTGGVLGSIQTFKPTSPTPAELAAQATLIDAIVNAVIGGTGHDLQRPPISSTIKVAIASTIGACAKDDVPRDRTNGWDMDPATRRIVFFGNCLPATTGVKVAVSYKYWIDASPDKNGDACGGECSGLAEICDATSRQCVCTQDCGGCARGFVCNRTSCSCDVDVN